MLTYKQHIIYILASSAYYFSASRFNECCMRANAYKNNTLQRDIR